MGNFIFLILIFIFVLRGAMEGEKKSSRSTRGGSASSRGMGGMVDEIRRGMTVGGAGETLDEILRTKPPETYWPKKSAQEKPTVRTPEAFKRPPTGKQVEAEQKRRNAAERSHSERRWAEARRKQEDALLVHSAGVDSCEGRLESLKVLYDAGILDREEYRERVARVRSQHSHR